MDIKTKYYIGDVIYKVEGMEITKIEIDRIVIDRCPHTSAPFYVISYYNRENDHVSEKYAKGSIEEAKIKLEENAVLKIKNLIKNI
jgi:hypothetical protein